MTIAPAHILIVEARFYEDIADQLARGAVAELDAAGATHERLAVPGAFEIPAAVKFAALASAVGRQMPPFDGYVTLGCVIRGETDHYDHICRENARATQNLAVEHNLAVGYGVLTCDTREQARARASVDGGDKGADVARACLRMVELKRPFGIER